MFDLLRTRWMENCSTKKTQRMAKQFFQVSRAHIKRKVKIFFDLLYFFLRVSPFMMKSSKANKAESHEQTLTCFSSEHIGSKGSNFSL